MAEAKAETNTRPAALSLQHFRGPKRARSSERATRWLALFLIFLAMAVTEMNGAETKTKRTREYDLKAAFLFNFSQFVEWPRDAFPQTNTPFVIGVLGEDPFGKSLDEIVANELARGHQIVVRRYRDVGQISACHILYVGASETPRFDSIFEFLRGKTILAVGEAERFTTRGGMIGFEVEDSKVRLKINFEAAKAARLTISSKLLRQADILDSKPVKQYVRP